MLLFLNVATKNSENTISCYDKGDINIYIGIVLIDRNLCVPFTLCYQDSSSFLFYIKYRWRRLRCYDNTCSEDIRVSGDYLLNVATKNSQKLCYDEGDINIGIVPIDRNLCVPFTLCYLRTAPHFYILYQIQLTKVKMLW